MVESVMKKDELKTVKFVTLVSFVKPTNLKALAQLDIIAPMIEQQVTRKKSVLPGTGQIAKDLNDCKTVTYAQKVNTVQKKLMAYHILSLNNCPVVQPEISAPKVALEKFLVSVDLNVHLEGYQLLLSAS